MNNKIYILIGVLAFIVTILVAIIAESYLGGSMNWQGAGAVFAIATMGLFIMWFIRINHIYTD